MITGVTADTVTLDSGGGIPMWKFLLRPDAMKLLEKAQGNVLNLYLVEEAGNTSSFLPQKRYADWPIDFDKFNDGVWTLEETDDIEWPRLRRVSDNDSELMSRDDFFTRVPNYQTILNRLRDDASQAAFYQKFTKTPVKKSTLSKPQQEYNELMEEYERTPKKQRTSIVDKIVKSQWVQSQKIPAISNYPTEELRSRLMEK